MILDSLFPSVVAREEHPDWANYLLPIVNQYFAETPNTNDSFYYNGRTTHHTGFDPQNDPRFMGFTDFIKEKGREFLEVQGFDPNGVKFNPYFFLNSFTQGSAHPKHVHSQCTISGIFYLQTPPGSSHIRFIPNQPFRDFFDYFYSVKDPDNYFAKSYFDYEPYPGLLVMWPAWLYHEVPPNNSVEPRVSIVFNL
jgi:uncharacterized protein (TIGR02466 family)